MVHGRRGFTLIELLVVIMVIVLLMALVIPAIGLARRKGQEARTRAALMEIQAGISKFQVFNSRLPEGSVSGAPDFAAGKASASYQNLFDGGWTATHIKADEVAENATLLLWQLASVDNENFGKQSPYRGEGATKDLLVDTWDKPIVYRPFSLYPFAAGASIDPINSDSPPNPDSYQLWSYGYARLNNNGVDGSDDISTWKK